MTECCSQSLGDRKWPPHCCLCSFLQKAYLTAHTSNKQEEDRFFLTTLLALDGTYCHASQTGHATTNFYDISIPETQFQVKKRTNIFKYYMVVKSLKNATINMNVVLHFKLNTFVILPMPVYSHTRFLSVLEYCYLMVRLLHEHLRKFVMVLKTVVCHHFFRWPNAWKKQNKPHTHFNTKLHFMWSLFSSWRYISNW